MAAVEDIRRPLLIALTEQGQKPDRGRSVEAGVHLHLLKPINKDFLSKVLRRFQSVIMPPSDFQTTHISIQGK